MHPTSNVIGPIGHALLDLAAGDAPAARSVLSHHLADSPGDALAAALARHLESVRRGGVYEHPEAFQAFIDHGGNPALYAGTIDALRAVHEQLRPAAVLDIGCGDGRVTLGSLTDATSRVDLVEPSAPLLDQALAAFAAAGRPAAPHAVGIEELLAATDTRWDLVQSTFALHNLDAQRRGPVLVQLAARAWRLAIVEFDVPSFADHSPEHAAYAVQTYRRGIAEYPDHPHVVDGFLIPVLVAQFDPSRPRHTHEQPTMSWEAELVAAGWSHVGSRKVADYWWAPARLITAVATL